MKVRLVDLVTPPCGKNLTTAKKIDILNILAQCHYQQTLTCLHDGDFLALQISSLTTYMEFFYCNS